ncbi:MAG: hypothetical protein K8H88_14145 [Sandaracinaceae bacterium]|nr:hypothetical protein [Sandaracinaceae bacterium]
MSNPLRDLYDRFDPDGTPRVEWRVDRPLSPATEILGRLKRRIGDGRFLVVGTVGTGKSTELLRIAEGRAKDSFVVQLDLVQHFDRVVGDLGALQKVTSWEVVFLAALAVARAARERLQFEFVDGALADLALAWKRAADKGDVPDVASAETDFVKLAKSMVILASTAVGGAAAGSAAGDLLAPLDAVETKWKLPIGRARKPLDDQMSEVQTLVQAANVIVNNVQHQLGAPVLLVLDGLDRVEGRDEACALFGDSALLGHLQCNSVVCAPFVLRHDTTLVTVRRFDVKVLVNEPVLDQESPDEPGPGVDLMMEIFRRRTADLTLEVDEAMVRDLAYRSGGRLRDFVKLVRELAGQVVLRDGTSPEQRDVEAALREQRLLLEAGLTTEHVDLLRGVISDPKHRLPSGPLSYELLRTSRLLPYPDGSEWYYPHALLLKGDLLR